MIRPSASLLFLKPPCKAIRNHKAQTEFRLLFTKENAIINESKKQKNVVMKTHWQLRIKAADWNAGKARQIWENI